MGDWTIERVVHNQSFARASRVRVKILRQTLLKLFKKIKHTVLSVGSIFYRYLPCKVRQSRWKTGENQPCLPSRPGANFFFNKFSSQCPKTSTMRCRLALCRKIGPQWVHVFASTKTFSFHGPVYFQNGFGANFEYFLSSTNQSATSIGLKMKFFAF